MSLILHDAHFHISDEQIKEDVGSRIFQNKSKRFFLLNGTEAKNWGNVINISKRCPFVVPFIGTHPWYVDDFSNDNLSLQEELIRDNPNLGIGEIGLDNSNHTKQIEFNKQEELFCNQLTLAIKYTRPVSFHVVKKWDIFFNYIKQYTPQKFLVHGFSHSKELAKNILDLGGFISIGKSAINKESNYDTIRWLPIDNILVESDATIPAKDISSNSHLDNIQSIYENLATIRNMDINTLALNINKNILSYLSPLKFELL